MDKKEIKAGIVILIALIVSVAMTLLSSKVGFIISFIVFTILYILINKFEKIKNNKILKWLYLPFFLIFSLLKFIKPIFSLILNSIYYLLIASIPIIFFYCLKVFNIIDFSYEKGIFLTLTTITIMSVALNKYILWFILKCSFLFTENKDRFDTLELIKLTKYILTRNNIRYVIYFVYFVFLFVFSYNYLDGETLFKSKLLDSAILQAFLVFVAFDSFIINSKNIKLLPSVILKSMLIYFSYDVTDEYKKIQYPKKTDGEPETNDSSVK